MGFRGASFAGAGLKPSPSMGEGLGGGGLSGNTPHFTDSTPTLPSPIKGEGPRRITHGL
jgi:hypothetical protein